MRNNQTEKIQTLGGKNYEKKSINHPDGNHNDGGNDYRLRDKPVKNIVDEITQESTMETETEPSQEPGSEETFFHPQISLFSMTLTIFLDYHSSTYFDNLFYVCYTKKYKIRGEESLYKLIRIKKIHKSERADRYSDFQP